MRFWIATGFGSGLAPVAPGTAGSAVALVLFWLTTLPGIGWLPAAAFVVVLVAGFWSAGEAARRLGRDDPGAVVYTSQPAPRSPKAAAKAASEGESARCRIPKELLRDPEAYFRVRYTDWPDTYPVC